MTRQPFLPSLLSTTAAQGMPSSSNEGAPLPSLSGSGLSGEFFGNWSVVCVGREGRKVHVARFRRAQMGPASKPLIDLGLSGAGAMLGVLTMPHGLKHTEGVRLQVDSGELFPKLPFASSGPLGGVVRLDMKAETVTGLRAAENFKIYARAASTGKRLVFSIPLDGFAAAVDRLQELKLSRVI
ncbi:invasion protein IalB [Neorhizobium galegae]|uniref:invasion associated locus B family protein n=1 Tax=Neorhizobium galegae TaxID=399 RepID=UPI001AE64B70|nr:invasion associated locus B family protein [Neorhizobium galegae]MBP2562226.1 invasion protein IalB [Neorhizobium galegae]